MTLEESTDGLDQIESNGITAYIDSNLKGSLTQFGEINVDFVTNESGNSGFTIRAGSPDCGSCGSAGESGCS
jgi:hypothetical protein